MKTEYFYQQIVLFGESFSSFLWDQVHAIPFEINPCLAHLSALFFFPESFCLEDIHSINSKEIPISGSSPQPGQTLSILIRSVISEIVIDPFLPHLYVLHCHSNVDSE